MNQEELTRLVLRCSKLIKFDDVACAISVLKDMKENDNVMDKEKVEALLTKLEARNPNPVNIYRQYGLKYRSLEALIVREMQIETFSANENRSVYYHKKTRKARSMSRLILLGLVGIFMAVYGSKLGVLNSGALLKIVGACALGIGLSVVSRKKNKKENDTLEQNTEIENTITNEETKKEENINTNDYSYKYNPNNTTLYSYGEHSIEEDKQYTKKR